VHQRSVLIAATLACLLAAAFVLARKPLLLAIGDFLVVEDVLHAADVIHVIAGPDDRTDYAIQLYKQGYAKRILFTGGWCTEHNYYHGQHGRERALEQGVPPEAIVSDESPVTSTYAEVERLKALIEVDPAAIQSVISVSDPYHMRRARWTYRRVLGKGIRVQMAPIPFASSTYSRYWWTDPASRQYVKEEYLKLAYYCARYRLSWGPLREWLASLDRE